MGERPVLDIEMYANNRGLYRNYIKRPMDFLISLLALVVLWPILLILAALVRVNVGKPVLFSQQRPGLNEKIFTIYKFRTMTDDQDEKGDLLPDSVRLNKFGEILRATSLDELPELFNIIRGDMAIVGPRPLLKSYLPYYTDMEKLRHTIRPGLTGWAQINGRNYLDWDHRLERDIEYVFNCSFLFDIKIIILSILYVFDKKNVAVDSRMVESNLAEERLQNMRG